MSSDLYRRAKAIVVTLSANAASGMANGRYTASFVSKRTVKRKLRKKKKANHGKKPNCGRG